MTAIGKPLNEFPISKALEKSCKLAHSCYVAALEENKKTSLNEEKSRKRKLKLEERAAVQEKKKVLETCIKDMESDVENYSTAAEKKSDLTLLTKANSFRKTIQEKKKVLSSLEEALFKLDEEAKNI